VSFDQERYEREVLEPARLAGNEPPRDLGVRYALTPELLASPAEFASHVAEVAMYWNALKQQRRYQRLAGALLAAHSQLVSAGLDASRVEEERQQAEAQLARRVTDLSATTSCVSSNTLQRLMRESGFGPALVRAALLEHGVRVVDPVELGGRPPTGKFPDLRAQLRVLGRRLSAEVVFEDLAQRGFRVLEGFSLLDTGERLVGGGEDAPLRHAQRRVELGRADERRTAAAKVLAILLELAEQPGALDVLVRWEVAQALREVPVTSLSQRVLAREAGELGLEAGEADVLALSVIESGRPGPGTPSEEEVRQALGEGRLREARRLAASLVGADAPPLREAVAGAERRVTDLSDRAAEAMAGGAPEQAAALLAEALRDAADDEDLGKRLRAIPPPSPAAAEQTAEGDRVTVGWRPSPVRTGAVHYRVVRGLRRWPRTVHDGTEVGTTDGSELVDAEPPAGQPVFHGVFASRDGRLWSPPAWAGPVVLRPEVRGLRLTADHHAVAATWEAPAGAARVEVARLDPPSASGGRGITPVPRTTLLGFTDPDVEVDRTYAYQVWVVYLDQDGKPYRSSGVVASVTAEAPAEAVRDLRVEVVAGAEPLRLVATWTPPPRGQVRIRARPDAGALRGQASPDGLAALGEELPGVPERLADGRVRLDAPADGLRGRCQVTPVTVGGSSVAVGETVDVPVAAPVTGLVARRFGETVRLSWVWPPESGHARVRWRAPDGEARAHCSRRQYEDGGGFEVAVGREATVVAVEALVHGDREVAAPPVEVLVEGLGSAVRYGIRRARLGSRARTLVVEAEGPCELPALVLVLRAGTVPPLRPDQGTPVVRVPAQRLDPSRPLLVPLELPSGRARLRLFPERTAAIQLVHPPPAELEL
jgi:hypothetical protein